MAIRIDPEGNETRALLDLADLAGLRVLEIGSGTGRLTWRYVRRARHVTVIDPFSDGIRQAKQELPDELRERAEFRNVSFDDFDA